MSWDGQRLRALMRERGISLTDLADRLNVSRQAVNDWVRNQVPKGSHLIKLSKILDTNPAYFFPEELIKKISVPLHRKRGVAKVSQSMQQDAFQMAQEYENLFKTTPASGLIPVLRVSRRDEENARKMANELRMLAQVESGKPLDYQHTFNLISGLKIIIIFRDFPQSIKGYAFYCNLYGHRVVFVNNSTNVLDLIFPLLHETIHAIREGDEGSSYDEEEESFCDAVAGSAQFPNEYLESVYNTIEGRRESHQINLLKDFSSKNGHAMFGIVEKIKDYHPNFRLQVAGADTNLKKQFNTIGNILFSEQDAKCYFDSLKELTPHFFEMVSNRISDVSTRKLGEWLGLENSLDAKLVANEWKKLISCN